MKNFDYYSCDDLDYPVKPKKAFLPSNSPSEQEVAEYLEIKANYDSLIEKYKELKGDYDALKLDRQDEFWGDARIELGCQSYSDKIWDKCCAKAWEDGHSGGWYEVFNYLSSITDFVDEILEELK